MSVILYNCGYDNSKTLQARVDHGTGSWVKGLLGHINRWVSLVMGHDLLTQ